MDYAERTLDQQLDELMLVASAIAIEGPKGVGKTATAMRRADTAWMLDDRDQRRVLDSDSGMLTRSEGTLLIDEWQRLPHIWDVVRRSVDEGAEPGRYLLTGSASPASAEGTHSGAGRILSVRMRPMAFHERGLCQPTVSLGDLLRGSGTIEGSTELTARDYFEEIAASGFPAIRRLSAPFREDMLEAYLQRVIDRDLPDLGFTSRRPETLRRWLAAYAAASSTTTKYSEILDATTSGDGHQPSKATTVSYRDHLTQLWLLDPIPGWSPSMNPFARLQQAPKHNLADPALAARLLNLNAETLGSPRGAHMAGRLLESLVALGVRVAAQPVRGRVGHLRTGNGDREIDLIVEGRDGRILGIEVKLTTAPNDEDVRHLHWLRDRAGEDVADLIVVTTGKYAYRRPDGIAVVPFGLLGE